MSKSLGNSAESQFKKTLSLLEKGKLYEALEELEKAEEAAKLLLKDPRNTFFEKNLQTKLFNVFNLGYLLVKLGRFFRAQYFYELSLLISKKLLQTDPENVAYQSYVGTTLNNLGNLLSDMGRIEDAKNRYENALDMRQKLLQTDPENVTYQSDVAMTLNNLGALLKNMGRIEDAKNRYENALDMRQKLLQTDPENVVHQSYVGGTLNNLGNLLKNMGRIEDAKNRYENALDIYEKLLQTDPENVVHQSYVGTTLNNLGNLLKNMGRIEDAKNRYENALTIYTEPMQYLTIDQKSNSIIKLIGLNSEEAKNESNFLNKRDYLKEIVKICKKYSSFFITYDLVHERKLATEAEFKCSYRYFYDKCQI